MIYHIAKFILYLIVKILFPHRVKGRENIPKDGPFIICSNHLTMIDPVVMLSNIHTNKMFFMGKNELFNNRILNWFFRTMGGFPVSRGTADMNAIKECISHLNDGNAMMIFPEGTRNKGEYKSLLEFHDGISILVIKTGVPVIPCFIDAPKGFRPYRPITLHLGKPMYMSNYYKTKLNRENLNKCTEEVKNNIIALMG